MECNHAAFDYLIKQQARWGQSANIDELDSVETHKQPSARLSSTRRREDLPISS